MAPVVAGAAGSFLGGGAGGLEAGLYTVTSEPYPSFASR